MWQATCGVVMRSVRNENGTGGSSPSWTSSPAQSIVVPSSRGGVPVLSRPSAKPARRKVCDRPSDGASPTRPAGIFSCADMNEPAAERCRWSAPRAPPRSRRPSPSTMPPTRPLASSSRSSAAPSRIVEAWRSRQASPHRLGDRACGRPGRAARAPPGPCCGSACGTGCRRGRSRGPSPHRARRSRAPDGPWRGRRSPGCTTSRRSSRDDASAAQCCAPIRAAAAAASQPAWPPPITTTSYVPFTAFMAAECRRRPPGCRGFT